VNTLLEGIDQSKRENDVKDLRSYSLCYLIIFNRRRSGEVANMTIGEFQDRQKWKTNVDESTMSDTEKILMKRLDVSQCCTFTSFYLRSD
jgi:outer membrane protein assembly factor BamB